jgi:hypothetical protein
MFDPKKKGLPYSKKDVSTIRFKAKQGIRTIEIAKLLDRTESGIRGKASRERISLKPIDKNKRK